GRVAHDHAARVRRGAVHVVESGPGAHDHAQVGSSRQHVGRDLGGAAHEQALHAAQRGHQVRRREPPGLHHVVARLADALHRGRVDAVAGEDLHAASQARRAASMAPEPLRPSAAVHSSSAPSTTYTSERSYAPMCPMRSILPLVWSWPPATVMPCVSRSRLTTAPASTPAGGSSAVTELAGLFENSVQPSACAPARTAAPSRAWRACTFARPSSRI